MVGMLERVYMFGEVCNTVKMLVVSISFVRFMILNVSIW